MVNTQFANYTRIPLHFYQVDSLFFDQFGSAQQQLISYIQDNSDFNPYNHLIDRERQLFVIPLKIEGQAYLAVNYYLDEAAHETIINQEAISKIFEPERAEDVALFCKEKGIPAMIDSQGEVRLHQKVRKQYELE